MSAKAPASGANSLDRFKHWRPDYQAKTLELLRERERSVWTPFYCLDAACNGFAHVAPKTNRECPAPTGHVWVQARSGSWVCKACRVGGIVMDPNWLFNHARADQRPPPWRSRAWRTWFMKGGRGSGKTETGARLTHRVTEVTPRIILIGATGPDLRDTMVEGESGILATSPPGKRPTWEPSLKKLTWPNGCIAKGYSAEEPDRLRGPQSGFIWGDEPAHWPLVKKVWANALLGLRMGRPSHALATSTPLPIEWVKELLANARTIATTVSTYANLENLDPAFRQLITEEFEGSPTGAQELHGEVMEDVEGSLWKMAMMRRVRKVPAGVSLIRVVVAVDPAGTVNPKSDDTGIVVVGLGDDKMIYVLADYTGKYSPAGWSEKAVWAYSHWSADAIVAEKNYGGDMVRHTLESVKTTDVPPPVIEVTSRRGKAIRAEPIVGLYEKGRVVHVVGEISSGLIVIRNGVEPQEANRLGIDLAALESEQTMWVPGSGPSPNRVDALVHGVTELAKGIIPAEIATPESALAGMSVPSGGGRGLAGRRTQLTGLPGWGRSA